MSRKITVFEDDVNFASMLRAVLEVRGHAVTVFGDTTQMRPHLRDHCPDIIILDIQMPGTGGGPGVLKHIRSDLGLRDLPVVVVSAMPLQAQRRWFGADPRVRLLQKPIEIQDLHRAIDELLSAG